MTHRTIPHVEILGGSKWSEDELAEIANATEHEVPLRVDGQPAGIVSNIRVAGKKIFADLRRVPLELAALFPTRLKRIGTSVWKDGGLRSVQFFTGQPAKDYGDARAEALKMYTLDASVLRLGTIVDEDADSGARVRRETASMKPGTVLASYEDLPGDIVMERVAAYRVKHPQVSVEMATKSLLDLDPLLKQAYVQVPWVTITPTGGSPMQEPINAGVFQQAQAEAHRRATARAAKDGLDYEVALRLVLGEDDVLRRQYLGRL
jgi:hypothetical protein